MSTSAQSAPPDGPYIERHDNGKPKIKGHYKSGNKEGVWYELDPNGNMLKKEKFKHNVVQWQIFYEKGKVIRTIDKKGNVKERPKCGC
jgi:antitoxin component YwqK of YwqJK toxin-antitoxin module